MKHFLVLAIFFICLLPAAQAQSEADAGYVTIYGLVQQADDLLGSRPQDALQGYMDAQAKLQKFQKIYPSWNPAIVNFRLSDLDKKITQLNLELAPRKVVTPVIATNDDSIQPQPSPLSVLQQQLQSAQVENQTWQAKLKEALATQPAAVDSGELAAAQAQIRLLMKENALLAAATNPKTMAVTDTNGGSQLRQQLAESAKKLKGEQARAERLAAENISLQKNLVTQRDDLLKQLAAAEAKNSRHAVKGAAAAQITQLSNEVEVLHARVAMDEAKAVPYTADELALFQSSPPAAPPVQRSVHEMPAGTRELVISAQKHFSAHEFDLAEADYQKILEHDQNNGLALGNMATIELQEGKLEDAEKHLKLALAQSPEDAYNLSALGSLKFQEGKYDEALDLLSRAAKLDPHNPETLNYLGVTLSHKGLRLQAETTLREALEVDPNYAPAHNNLAVIYLNQTPPLPQLARWHYQKALDAGQPHNLDVEKMLADKGAPVRAH